MEVYLKHQVYLCMHMALNISLYCLRRILAGKLSLGFFLSHTHFRIELCFVHSYKLVHVIHSNTVNWSDSRLDQLISGLMISFISTTFCLKMVIAFQ